ncbi:MAG: hypothetical protein KF795_24795 [Labilithrix sp.]|nr:hypothetical protein [Labilithrix sp.]
MSALRTAPMIALRTMSGLVTLALAASGCGHTDTHQALLRAPTAPTGKTVELYMADQPLPERPFYEIALVQAIGFGDEAHPEDVAKALTDKAAGLGCDAVLRTFIDQGYARAHASGVCVKWLGPGPAAPTPVLPPDRGANPSPPSVRPAPAPRIEPLPSGGPSQGGGR